MRASSQHMTPHSTIYLLHRAQALSIVACICPTGLKAQQQQQARALRGSAQPSRQRLAPAKPPRLCFTCHAELDRRGCQQSFK
eukprot:1161518-Pelagomonas_calceolata.AAC.4